jgi:hypothetical protein
MNEEQQRDSNKAWRKRIQCECEEPPQPKRRILLELGPGWTATAMLVGLVVLAAVFAHCTDTTAPAAQPPKIGCKVTQQTGANVRPDYVVIGWKENWPEGCAKYEGISQPICPTASIENLGRAEKLEKATKICTQWMRAEEAKLPKEKKRK